MAWPHEKLDSCILFKTRPLVQVTLIEDHTTGPGELAKRAPTVSGAPREAARDRCGRGDGLGRLDGAARGMHDLNGWRPAVRERPSVPSDQLIPFQ